MSIWQPKFLFWIVFLFVYLLVIFYIFKFFFIDFDGFYIVSYGIITSSQFSSIPVKQNKILIYFSLEFQNAVYHFFTILIEEYIKNIRIRLTKIILMFDVSVNFKDTKKADKILKSHKYTIYLFKTLVVSCLSTIRYWRRLSMSIGTGWTFFIPPVKN